VRHQQLTASCPVGSNSNCIVPCCRLSPCRRRACCCGRSPALLIISINCALITIPSPLQEEGLLCGISSGPAVQAAIRVGQRPGKKGKMVVVSGCLFCVHTELHFAGWLAPAADPVWWW